ncbi:phosphatase PAP2 family protein [Octadecabacter sp.]|nr:phosphatase PAP2 family protein [Octadecabacter sp.]
MRGFFVTSVIYLIAAILIVWTLRHGASGIEGLFSVITNALLSVIVLGLVLAQEKTWILIPVVAVILLGVFKDRSRFMPVIYSIMGVFMLQAGFALMKGSITLILPFWADVHLANIDKALHGIDPWMWAFSAPDWMKNLAVKFGPALYTSGWAIAALGFPVLVAATDQDDARVRRSMILYVFCWLGVGTVFATLGSSAGPVFLYRLTGSDRFSELIAALSSSGLSETSIGMTQNTLWSGYSTGNAAIGISAFPSVHLAISTVAAIYLGERRRRLIPFGVAFVMAILFMSVFSGYHYAVDGYASIILVIFTWSVLRNRLTANGEAPPKERPKTGRF